MKESPNYSLNARKEGSYKIIDSATLTSIINGDDASYLRDFNWIEIDRHIIKDTVTFNGVAAKSRIKISNCFFEGFFNVKSGLFESSVSISNCYFEKGVTINGGEFKDELTFDNLHIKGTFFIEDGIFKEIKIQEFYDLSKLWIVGGTFDEIELTANSILSELEIFNKRGLFGNIRVRRINIKHIGIHDSNGSKELYFEEIKCNKFATYDFSNTGNLKIFGLKPFSEEVTSYFEITKSNLGKAQFSRVEFDKFTEVIFIDSYLGEINVTNSDWGNNFRGIRSLKYPEEDFTRPPNSKQEINQLKENFRQLKFIYDKQGDKIMENRFYQLEMNKYYQLIPWSNWMEKFWEKIIIFLSRHLSSYGTSFSRPLIGILIANEIILLILIFCFSFKGLELTSLSNSSAEGFQIGISEFFKLVNPLHKIDDELKGWAILWDLIARISSSYFIYNLIRASRRFIK